MKRTTVRLSEEVCVGMRKLAFGSNTSVSALIRLAIDKTYREDIEDIQVMEEEIAKYRANPESAIPVNKIKKKNHDTL